MELGESIFKYRLSQAHCVVEIASDILCHHFCCLQLCSRNHKQCPESLCLHNLMKTGLQNNDIDCEVADCTVTPGAWRYADALTEIHRVGKYLCTSEGKQQRMYLTEYYTSLLLVVCHGKRTWSDLHFFLMHYSFEWILKTDLELSQQSFEWIFVVFVNLWIWSFKHFPELFLFPLLNSHWSYWSGSEITVCNMRVLWNGN